MSCIPNASSKYESSLAFYPGARNDRGPGAEGIVLLAPRIPPWRANHSGAGDHHMLDILKRLFRYKAWANDELLTALARLGNKAPVTNLAIQALSHSHVVDRIFLAHLGRRDHAYPSANLSHMPTLEDLSRDIRMSDHEYVDYVSALDCDQLAEQIDFTFTDGAPGCMSRAEMLMHVITHGVGHRGQVSAVMLLNSVTPANDGFTTYLHQAEASTRGRARS
jgi:uncharacterized damage-inducible protein DinB